MSEDDPDLGGRVLQIAEITSLSFPIDALVITLLCVAAAAIVIAPLLNMKLPNLPPLTSAGLGAVAVVVGVANYIRVSDQISKAEDTLGELAGGLVSVSIGMGVYITIIGAAAIAVCSFLDYQQRQKLAGAPAAPRAAAGPPPPGPPPGPPPPPPPPAPPR
jgi:hypothetical protein